MPKTLRLTIIFVVLLASCKPRAHSCRDFYAKLILTEQGHISLPLQNQHLNHEVAQRLLEQLGETNRRELRFFREDLNGPEVGLDSTLIKGDLLEYLNTRGDLQSFIPVVKELVDGGNHLAPLGYKAVPSGLIIFINKKYRKGDATGEFHQDGAGLIGFATIYSTHPELTTHYIDPKDLIPFSSLPDDLAGYTYVTFHRWIKMDLIKRALLNSKFYFYGTQGQNDFGPGSAEALWHRGPVRMFTKHPGDRIAIGLSFSFVKK